MAPLPSGAIFSCIAGVESPPMTPATEGGCMRPESGVTFPA